MRLVICIEHTGTYLRCGEQRVLGIEDCKSVLGSYYISSDYKLARVYMFILLKSDICVLNRPNQHTDKTIVQLFASLVLL